MQNNSKEIIIPNAPEQFAKTISGKSTLSKLNKIQLETFVKNCDSLGIKQDEAVSKLISKGWPKDLTPQLVENEYKEHKEYLEMSVKAKKDLKRDDVYLLIGGSIVLVAGLIMALMYIRRNVFIARIGFLLILSGGWLFIKGLIALIASDYKPKHVTKLDDF